MPPVITFIGRHDCGKTTLATAVVRHLLERGLRVGVVKSTKEAGIVLDRPGTDTARYAGAGATAVVLAAPDQTVCFAPPGESLLALAHRLLGGMDLVVGEGFKHEGGVPKIEVVRRRDQLLPPDIRGIIARASDLEVPGDYVFRLSEAREIADFIVQRLLSPRPLPRAEVLVDGRRLPLKDFVSQALAGTVAGFVDSLKAGGGAREIEVRIRLPRGGQGPGSGGPS